MEFSSIKTVYFLGIGGIGMSALARYFKSMNVAIYGYDKTSTLLTTQLISEGMKIHFDENINLIPDNIDFVVYTPAIPSNHLELFHFQNNKYNLLKRSEVLGIIAKNSKAIGVAGTHGKTTISTMVAHLLKQSSIDCNAFLGGISKNYNSNLLLSQKSEYVVIEADEFDRSFLQLSPYIASISSIDADHLDIYGDKTQLIKSFEDYISQIQKGGKLIIKKGLELSIPADLEYYTYSLNEKSDFYAQNIRIEDGYYIFTFIHPFGKIENIKLGYPGLHNIENSIVAIAIAHLTGVKEDEIKKAMKSFHGVNRRFDIRINNENLIYIDDYAHHPEELKACISSVRDLYRNKKITGIFQPHLYSRTRDFADDFAKSLELLDTVVLLDIYPARELPIQGVSSQMLLDKINLTEKYLIQKSEILQFLKNKSPEILLTLGAGDIDQLVEPIEKIYK
jgi:UDP-N-acetylmuramate--alanine ligase